MATQPPASSPLGSAQVVRMSLHPPPCFPPGGDLDLWLKRFKMYVKHPKIAQEQWTSELLPLLDDEPFRTISQQGLVESTNYKAVVE